MSLYIYGWDPLVFESRLPFRGPARDCERPLMRPEQYDKIRQHAGARLPIGSEESFRQLGQFHRDETIGNEETR
jgi:hypothetical protein